MSESSACVACGLAKVKCDKLRPCARCQGRGIECCSQDRLRGRPRMAAPSYSSTSAEGLSSYELLRQERVRENAAVLQELGLGDAASKMRSEVAASRAKPSAHARKRTRATSAPLRVSPRTLEPKTKAAKTTSYITPATTGLPLWAEKVFATEDGATLPPVSWSKHHRHLTLSLGKHMVATTGCAGYGAALAARGDLLRYWEVRIEAVGVGGSAVGLVRAGWRGPFKSLGSATAGGTTESLCVAAFHSSGSLFVDGAAKEGFAPPFGQGDVIGVYLRANGDLVFYVNGKQTAVAVSLPHCKETSAHGLVLACQPYMGGVVRITGARKMGPT